jgi:hypothetical protein
MEEEWVLGKRTQYEVCAPGLAHSGLLGSTVVEIGLEAGLELELGLGFEKLVGFGAGSLVEVGVVVEFVLVGSCFG